MKDTTVKIMISKKTRRVVSVENNFETEGYRKAKVFVGDRLPKSLRALMLMNPHRFSLKYV